VTKVSAPVSSAPSRVAPDTSINLRGEVIRPRLDRCNEVQAECARNGAALLAPSSELVYIYDAFRADLLSLTLERCEHPLSEMLNHRCRRASASTRSALLGRRVQFLHDGTSSHDDLHPGNVLVLTQGPAPAAILLAPRQPRIEILSRRASDPNGFGSPCRSSSSPRSPPGHPILLPGTAKKDPSPSGRGRSEYLMAAHPDLIAAF